MSGAHSDDDRADEFTERYRAASAADPARPSDALRESIFAYARTVAVQHATRGLTTARRRRSAASDSSWRIRAAASVVVAAFAALLAWHSYTPAPIPHREPNSSRSQVDALNPPATGFPAETAPAPNAATTPSRQRAAAPPVASSRAQDATADLGSGSNATGAERALANQLGTPRAAPSPAAAPPAAAPPVVEARRSEAREAAASARSPARDPQLLRAAGSGNLELVDQLLRSGASTEQTDARGRTALLVATLRGDLPMVRRLLAAGARADVADEDGDTALAAARRQGPPELASLLERASRP